MQKMLSTGVAAIAMGMLSLISISSLKKKSKRRVLNEE
jgi:hypothetical protein